MVAGVAYLAVTVVIEAQGAHATAIDVSKILTGSAANCAVDKARTLAFHTAVVTKLTTWVFCVGEGIV